MQILPFLALGIGVDAMFVLVQNYAEQIISGTIPFEVRKTKMNEMSLHFVTSFKLAPQKKLFWKSIILELLIWSLLLKKRSVIDTLKGNVFYNKDLFHISCLNLKWEWRTFKLISIGKLVINEGIGKTFKRFKSFRFQFYNFTSIFVMKTNSVLYSFVYMI